MTDFDTFTKKPKNVGDLGKIIVAKGFKRLPKVQKIAQFGHTDRQSSQTIKFRNLGFYDTLQA